MLSNYYQNVKQGIISFQIPVPFGLVLQHLGFYIENDFLGNIFSLVADTLKPSDQQFDVGPKTSAQFAAKIGEFIEKNKANPKNAVAFHNGVFGMFEDPKFEAGTKAFISQLKRLKDAGHPVYIGGGEGGTALEKYGRPDWITHCFTAGGTVLNALGSEPVPYLVALREAAKAG